MSTYLHTDHLLSATDVRVAHRGGSRNWAEHSAQAYRNSYARGYRAFEVSVAVSAQEGNPGVLGGGELFLMHDWTLDRTSNVTDMISQATPWSTIENLLIYPGDDAEADATPQPYLTLDDYLDEFGADVISLIDFKDLQEPDALRVLQKIKDRNLMHRCMGKQVYGNADKYDHLADQAAMWNAEGAPTWGALYSQHVDDFPVLAPRHEILGLDNSSDYWPNLIEAGGSRPILGHVVQGKAGLSRSYYKGAIGIMCANPAYIPAFEPAPYRPGGPVMPKGRWTQPWDKVYIGDRVARAVHLGPNVVWKKEPEGMTVRYKTSY